jgi:hypothetical protein
MVNILYNNMNNRLLSGMVLPYVVCGVRERQSLVLIIGGIGFFNKEDSTRKGGTDEIAARMYVKLYHAACPLHGMPWLEVASI